MFDFTEEELNRYSRHILLQDVGVEGQEKIREGKVLVIGAGGLGAPVAMYLAAAGVGTIGIVDGDVVDLSNLQRQIIHTTPDVDKWKVESAKETINAINPHVKVNTYREFLMSDNALDIVKEYDFVVDGTDNFPVKFLINDACVLPMHVQDTSTTRSRTYLQSGRCVGSHRWYVGHDSGSRNAEVSDRCGRTADKQTAHLQRQDDGLPQNQCEEDRQVPHLWHKSNSDKINRLRTGRLRPQKPLMIWQNRRNFH